MNYDGHEALRRDMVGLANNLCDLTPPSMCWKKSITTGMTGCLNDWLA